MIYLQIIWFESYDLSAYNLVRLIIYLQIIYFYVCNTVQNNIVDRYSDPAKYRNAWLPEYTPQVLRDNPMAF